MDEKKNITPVLSDETDAASVPDAGELRRKKKRQRQLVTSILLAVYFIVAPLLSEDGNAADTTETEAVSVSAHQSSEVLSLTFPSSEESEGTITLSRGSSSADWEYVQRPGFPLSDTKLSKLASAVASISASREITEPESLTTYGLDNPSLTVTVGYSDGTTRSYSIGNYNEFSSVYYMMTDGSNTIYTVDSTIMRTFTVSEDDLISLAALPTDITYTGYSVTAPDGSADNYTGDMLTDSYTELLGKLELTGSLGDVMKESAQAAITYIRAHASELSVEPDFYKKKDIHIHVPEGAVPKDGPSAGVTIATALASELSGRAVRRDVAMTGEITLHGKVLPIGGLREKAMAAYKTGVKTVLIPRSNLRDLEEIDPVVREKLNFIPCSRVSEVFGEALI